MRLMLLRRQQRRKFYFNKKKLEEVNAMKPIIPLEQELIKLRKALETASRTNREFGLTSDEIEAKKSLWDTRDQLDDLISDLKQLAEDSLRLEGVVKVGAGSPEDESDSEGSLGIVHESREQRAERIMKEKVKEEVEQRQFEYLIHRKKKGFLDFISDTETEFEGWVSALYQITGKRPIWGKRLFIDLAPGFESSSSLERDFFEINHLLPMEYLHSKDSVLVNNRRAFVTLYDIRRICRTDLYHSQKLQEFWTKQRWLTQRQLNYFKYQEYTDNLAAHSDGSLDDEEEEEEGDDETMTNDD
ncbi:hypothetical protein LSM04_005784 [Trypanosoma melophagium]|uniref:uncharacterized protein n=1 Tax=Trypanosoma melophagium TaxID=715481 RepID=UPI00351A7F0C|nr:hypothetical protein LSM04_005784 [Trypanosoma melophagium]